MICKNCGNEFNKGVFCPACGANNADQNTAANGNVGGFGGLQNPNQGFQNPNQGFQNPNPIYPNPGYQNPNPIPPVTPVKKKRKTPLILALLAILLVIVIVIALIPLLFTSAKAKTKRVMKNYMNALESGDTDELFECSILAIDDLDQLLLDNGVDTKLYIESGYDDIFYAMEDIYGEDVTYSYNISCFEEITIDAIVRQMQLYAYLMDESYYTSYNAVSGVLEDYEEEYGIEAIYMVVAEVTIEGDDEECTMPWNFIVVNVDGVYYLAEMNSGLFNMATEELADMM